MMLMVCAQNTLWPRLLRNRPLTYATVTTDAKTNLFSAFALHHMSAQHARQAATVTVSASPIDSLRVAALQTLKNKKRSSFRPETPTTSDDATISLLYDDEPPEQSSVPPKPRTQDPPRPSWKLNADRSAAGELEDGEISDAEGRSTPAIPQSSLSVSPSLPALTSLNKPTPTNMDSDASKYSVSFHLSDWSLIVNGQHRFSGRLLRRDKRQGGPVGDISIFCMPSLPSPINHSRLNSRPQSGAEVDPVQSTSSASPLYPSPPKTTKVIARTPSQSTLDFLRSSLQSTSRF